MVLNNNAKLLSDTELHYQMSVYKCFFMRLVGLNGSLNEPKGSLYDALQGALAKGLCNPQFGRQGTQMTANAIGGGISQKSVIAIRCFLGRDKFDALLTSCGRPTNRLNPSPLDDPTQSKEWEQANRREYQREYYQEHREERCEYQREYYQEHREERCEYNREYYQEHREERCEYGREYRRDRFGDNSENDTDEQKRNVEERREYNRHWDNAKYQAKREEEGFKVCDLPNGRRAFFKPSAQSNTAEQQLNCEDQPYYEQDWFTKHFGIILVRALRSYNKFEGNLSYITTENLRALYEHIRMVEDIRKAYINNRQSLLDSLRNCSKKEDLNMYFNNEVILSIPPGTKLGLTIRKDNELGGVSITEVKKACEFKDLVGIGWRITSIDNVPVTSKDDFKAKDPNRHRVMRFMKPQS
jgi:hypothetical protein